MASSQVEIASSSPPFGCVLRDHNRRDQCKESNARANLQKNLKDLVKDRLQSCISDTDGDCSVSKEPNDDNDQNKSQQKKSKIQERWAQAREILCKNENGVKNHKKAKITREMVCSMLQIDNEDLSISGEQGGSNDQNQKKPKARETEQSDKNHTKLKVVKADNVDRSAHSEESNENQKNQKKLKIQERWARAREKVCNQPQSDNVDCSVNSEQSKEKNHNTIDCSVKKEESKNNEKNQKTSSKNQERWARAREKVCNNPQRDNVDSVVNNDKNHKKSKSNNEDSSIQEETKGKDKNLKKSKSNNKDCSVQEETKNKDKNLKKSKSNNEDSSVQEETKSKDKNLKNSKSNNGDCSVQEETKSNDKNLKKLRTHERWARAREIVCSFDRQGRDSNRQGVSSPLLGGGVSSLLQKWKGYEAEAKSLNSNTSTNTSPGCSIKSNSGITFIDNSSSYAELPPKTSPSSESSEPTSADERDGTARIINIDAFPDWESDKISLSGPPSSISRDSDAAEEKEKERVRVVDLIRKLTSVTKSTQQGCIDDIREGEQMLSSNESLPRVGIEMLCCPRIRGRQAFSNLLMQIERDRQRELEGLVERKPVSKFSHKGRIQALLKVRLMHRLAKIRDRAMPNSPVSSQLNRGTQGSNIMHLRERFCTGVEHGNREVVENAESTKNSCTSNQIKEETRHRSGIDKENSCGIDKESTSNQPKEEIHHHDVNDHKDSDKDVVHNVQYEENSSTINQLKEESSSPSYHLKESKPCEDVDTNMEQNTSKVENQGSLHEESIDIVCNIESLDEGNDEQQRVKETSHAQTIWEDIETCQDWLSDISQLRSEWEQMCNDQQLVETNNDWISDVARPKSDWEDLRRERYQEMLDPCSDNGDIRQLLERKSVSNFLSSNMRDAIDRLMMSRTQKQTPQIGTPVDKRKEEAEEQRYDELKYEHHVTDDDDDEDRRSIHYKEFNGYPDQTYPIEPHSQSLLSPWSDIQDIEVSDYSNQAASPLQKYISSNSSYRDNQHCSSFLNSPSIEMEFIYDLRGHIEQLHQEMSEIRKSLKSCISMQVKLQRSIKRSVRKEGKDSTRRVTKKGRCCVCNEKRIDSLLYRCGHMCTCFKCAHDLQTSTGRCPICQAPILDIVKPYADNR